MVQVGEKAPDFTLPSTSGDLHLRDLVAKGKVVLAFYTEDATPGCTQQLVSFKEEYATITECDARLVAISADSLESHRQFAQSLGGCPFPLASDEKLEVAKLYGVVSEDGRHSNRALFVVDERGQILLAIPWYQPGNIGQFMEVFKALGAL